MSVALNKAKLKLLEAEKEVVEVKKKQNSRQKHTGDYLVKAIETASSCTSVIPAEEERVMKLVDELNKKISADDYAEVKIKYLLHNLEIMKTTYPIYEEEAKRRKAHIDKINKMNRWGSEKQKCVEDTMYWFDNYAWTADPRKTGIWSLPFMLYDYQRETITWLEELIFTKQSSGIIEKSRDLGLSWLITALFYKHWQHTKDGAFNALMGSITSDECDKVGDPSSMFEKLRIQARLQPLGLLPKGWNCDIPYMKAVNPENGSTITGETSNGDFGRSGRYKVILFDEFSAFEQDTAAMTASSQSSPCKIYNSTARGMGNEFYRLAHSNAVEKLTLHWTKHPYKTEDWYNFQKLEMSDAQVAQELDINYDASQPNKVYYTYNELMHVCTHDEVMEALPSFRDRDGKFHIPMGHSIVMGCDVGTTEEHAHVVLWFVVLREGTKTIDGIDLSGSILCYREIVQPIHAPPRIWANNIKQAEGLLEPRMIVNRYISQEATTEQEVFWDEYRLDFEKWTPDYNAGIARVREYLDITRTNEVHPFRDITRRKLYPDHPPIMGRPTIFFVSETEQGKMFWDSGAERYRVAPAKDSKGLSRLRAEFPAYHYPKSELGKSVAKMRPKKAFDDAMDCLRCVATEYFAPLNRKTTEELFEEYLPDSVKSRNIKNIPVDKLGMAFLMREQEKQKFNSERQEQFLSYRDRLMRDAYK